MNCAFENDDGMVHHNITKEAAWLIVKKKNNIWYGSKSVYDTHDQRLMLDSIKSLVIFPR